MHSLCLMRTRIFHISVFSLYFIHIWNPYWEIKYKYSVALLGWNTYEGIDVTEFRWLDVKEVLIYRIQEHTGVSCYYRLFLLSLYSLTLLMKASVKRNHFSTNISGVKGRHLGNMCSPGWSSFAEFFSQLLLLPY